MAESDKSSLCPVCFNKPRYYSSGVCNHWICNVCSTRIRYLCRVNECPICRQEMPEVFHSLEPREFTNKLTPGGLFDKKTRTRFETGEVLEDFKALIDHVCPECHERITFPDFKALDFHCRKDHKLYFCELCTDNLKLFSHERRLYTHHQLLSHRKEGDPDDKSHKGHPICEFCRNRFMDDEQLFLHLRKHHFFCDLCDSDGHHNQYYGNYSSLKDHFYQAHYLCTEGECKDAKFTNAFKTEIDMKAHRSEVHGATLSKFDARRNRTLGVDVNYGSRNSRGGRDYLKQEHIMEEQWVQPLPDVHSVENFPALGKEGPPAVSSSSNDEMASRLALKSGKSVAKWNFSRPNQSEEEFPSLMKPSKSNSSPISQNVRVSRSNGRNNMNPKLESAWVNKKNGSEKSFASVSSKTQGSVKEEFPILGPPLKKKHNKGKNDKKKGNSGVVLDCENFEPYIEKKSGLQDAADCLESNNEDWTFCSKGKKPVKKLATNNSNIPGLNYQNTPKKEISLKTLTDDFPSLGVSKTKMSADFQPLSSINNDSNSNTAQTFSWGGARPKASTSSSNTKRPPPGFKKKSSYTYTSPSDFSSRNNKLLSTITRILGKKSYEFLEFTKSCGEFRKKHLSAEQFHDKCLELISAKEGFEDCFPEFIALLPDIYQQQELYQLHRVKNSSLDLELLMCDICDQILLKKDLQGHRKAHAMDNDDFPALLSL